MVKDTCNVQVLIMNLVGIKQVSVDIYAENALFFKQRHLKKPPRAIHWSANHNLLTCLSNHC